jgi:tRNA(Ile)-lysidine synthetase-like protein
LPPRLRVSYRRGGERLRGHAGRIVLKDLLQTSGLAPWQRPTVPLLGDGERIIAIADLWLDPAIRAPAGGASAAAAAGAGAAQGAPAVSERGRFRWRTAAH